MPSWLHDRLRYIALGAVTIMVGLAVHLRGGALNPAVRDVLGDALWAAMVTWVIGALAPQLSLPWRAAAAAAIAFVVEFSQLIDQPMLNALRRTHAGHLVLGNSFDARDLVAYAAGVIAAALFEWSTTASPRSRANAAFPAIDP